MRAIEFITEDLRKWFKEKWVRFGPDGKIRGDCARGDNSEGKPKCLPQSKAYSLGKKGRASAAARKRRQDPNAERSGKAINVATKKKNNEDVQRHLQPNFKNYSTADLLKMIKTIKKDNIGIKIITAISKELIRRKQGIVEVQLDEKCWDTHKQVGMKNKGGKRVPNCIPKESTLK